MINTKITDNAVCHEPDADKNALMGWGVVHPTSRVPGCTNPLAIINAPNPMEIIGERINGITRIGFNTIGSPKITGSLIQNNPGIKPILAVFV